MEDVRIKAFLAIETGSGYGDGYGDGYGSGYGDGDGYGYGSGDGSGYGSGDGSGIEELNGKHIQPIDGVPTIITAIVNNVAKGYILQGDLGLTPCYVVKGNNLFAHGSSVREAMETLTDKMFDDMPEEERIAEFIKAHPEQDKLYPNRDLYDWHHRLTGSCVAGRDAFVKDNELSMDGSITVLAFIELTKNAYGGATIRKLAAAYKEDSNDK